MLSLLATSAIALGAAFQGIGEGLEYTLFGLALVSALPVLWITLARIAERRYLTRPTKGFLAAALGFDVGGIALVAGAVLLLQSETSEAAPLLTAGGLLEGLRHAPHPSLVRRRAHRRADRRPHALALKTPREARP